MNTLYIVPTPIGNLEDITFRAVKVLKKVGMIVCEDTRVTRKLLDHYEISKRLITYHEHNEDERVEVVLRELLKTDVAVVSDAGTPGISDPGFRLVREAAKQGVKVVPLPGPSALITALVGSGLPTDSFVFVGFLPKKPGHRRKELIKHVGETKTLVFYESPYRLKEMLSDAYEVFGSRKMCIAREMSKRFEEFVRMDLSEVEKSLGVSELAGEVVVVIHGADKNLEPWSDEKVEIALKKRFKKKEGVARAAKSIAAESGWRKKRVYELGLRVQRGE